MTEENKTTAEETAEEVKETEAAEDQREKTFWKKEKR